MAGAAGILIFAITTRVMRSKPNTKKNSAPRRQHPTPTVSFYTERTPADIARVALQDKADCKRLEKNGVGLVFQSHGLSFQNRGLSL